jgi:serine/threonine protein kinase
MKVLPNNRDTSAEITILKYLTSKKCPWNIKYYGHHVTDTDKVQLYIEYFDGFELSQLITHISVKSDIVKWITLAGEIVSAVQCIHSIGVVHLDIKPGNILFSGDGIKLIDFGFSCLLANCSLKYIRGTTRYLAPEGYAPTRDNLMSIDVWAVGVTLYAMFYRYKFISDATQDIRKIVPKLHSNSQIEAFLPPATGSVENGIRSIILQLLDIDRVVRVENFRNIKRALDELMVMAMAI